MPKASTINEVSTGTLLPPISEGEAEGQVSIGRQQWGRDKTAILKKAIFLPFYIPPSRRSDLSPSLNSTAWVGFKEERGTCGKVSLLLQGKFKGWERLYCLRVRA